MAALPQTFTISRALDNAELAILRYNKAQEAFFAIDKELNSYENWREITNDQHNAWSAAYQAFEQVKREISFKGLLENLVAAMRDVEARAEQDELTSKFYEGR